MSNCVLLYRPELVMTVVAPFRFLPVTGFFFICIGDNAVTNVNAKTVNT